MMKKNYYILLFVRMYFLLIFISTLGYSYTPYTDSQCLNINFQKTIFDESAILSFFSQKIEVKKQLCQIEIKVTRFKFLSKTWQIDTCRGPTHLNYKDEIIKANGRCIKSAKQKNIDGSNSTEAFCTRTDEIFDLYENLLLIHAKGEKENLAADHGKIYCSYRLLKKYLEDRLIFNRHKKYDGVIVDKIEDSIIIDDKAVNEPYESDDGRSKNGQSSQRPLEDDPEATKGIGHDGKKESRPIVREL